VRPGTGVPTSVIVSVPFSAAMLPKAGAAPPLIAAVKAILPSIVMVGSLTVPPTVPS